MKKKFLFSLCGVFCAISFLALMGCPFPPKPAVTITARVSPEYRCPGQDVTVTWETQEGYGFALSTDPRVPEMPEVLHSEERSSGTIVIPASEIDGAGTIRIPTPIKLIFTPERNGEIISPGSIPEIQRAEVTVHTIYEPTEIIRTARVVTSETDASVWYAVNLPPDIFSSDLKVSEISIVNGCKGGKPEGSYQYDKGPATPNPGLLNTSNDFHAVLPTPVQAQGQWAIVPIEAACNKGDATIDVKFKLFCP